MHFRPLLLALLPIMLCVSCKETPDAPDGLQLQKLDVALWPQLKDDLDVDSLVLAIDRQLQWFQGRKDYRWMVGDTEFDGQHMQASLLRFKELYVTHGGVTEQFQRQLQEEFDLYAFTWDGAADVLITGYHAPVYAGAREPDATYQYPLYRLPPDLVHIETGRFAPSVLAKAESARRKRVPARVHEGKVVPYFSREEIDGQGALKGRGLELVYLNDYFEAFSFHVQGGGFVRLPSGEVMKFNYAGSNGHPYVSIGRLMVEAGKISRDEISMQALDAWFRNYPQDMWDVCFDNPSYVFYTTDGVAYAKIEPELFPHGVLGFPVTTRRSIATDKRFFPGGGLAFVQGVQRGKEDEGLFSAFVLDQDTGGAIRNNHIDWFLGAGEEAEHDAGLLKDETGKVFFLILKPTGTS